MSSFIPYLTVLVLACILRRQTAPISGFESTLALRFDIHAPSSLSCAPMLYCLLLAMPYIDHTDLA